MAEFFAEDKRALFCSPLEVSLSLTVAMRIDRMRVKEAEREGIVAFTEKPTGVEKELKDVLFKIWHNPEFVRGVLICLQTDEERLEVLDAIEAGELPEPGDITLFALNIHLNREERLKSEG